MKKLSKIMCYIGVGVLCFGVYYLCIDSMSWGLASVISFICGLILSYFINKKYKVMSSINKFIFSGIVVFLVDIILMNILITLFGIENSVLLKSIVIIIDLVLCYIFTLLFKKNDKKKVIFISSTGGHLNELLQLKPLITKYDSYLITEKTKSNKNLKDKYNNVSYLVYGTKKNLFTYFFIFSFNIIKSFILYLKIRPDVIVTTGTHTAVPMCYIGRILGSKVIFIETFANSTTKTVAGKLVYPIANTFVVQWESMLELYPKAIYGGWIY